MYVYAAVSASLRRGRRGNEGKRNMGWLVVVLYVLVVVSALLLIGLILIQPSKGGGMGAAFGGVGETVLGAHAGSHLTKATVVLTNLHLARGLRAVNS